MPSRYHWGQTHPDVENLQRIIDQARRHVVEHPLYAQLDSVEAVRIFMEHHVFAVWDFMSLLKSLQRRLTGVDVPWIPTGDPGCRRLINEIVLVEESDEIGEGEHLSHFELYLRGMEQAGADTGPVRAFLSALQAGATVETAIRLPGVPEPSHRFSLATWKLLSGAPEHALAAAFALGREDLIPDMFDQVASVDGREPGRLGTFVDYLRRHIEVDADEHTPMALQMLVVLCEGKPERWADCADVVVRCLRERALLWDGILAQIRAERREQVGQYAAPR